MDVIFILFLENKVDDGLYVTLLFFLKKLNYMTQCLSA
jgi:hypothetical protein